MKKLLIFVALIAAASAVSAQDAMKVIRVTPDGITWKDNPAIPKGGQFAVLQGDPSNFLPTTRSRRTLIPMPKTSR